jgi:PemK-like, MazF-like toxin of type II toxin-antitoxin system
MTTRGDVVIVEFPYVDGTRGKNRPALVVQCDRNNQRLQNTVIVMITGNIQRATREPTQLFIGGFSSACSQAATAGSQRAPFRNSETMLVSSKYRITLPG